MTGYGKASFIYKGACYLLEIHSVNRKGLDLNLFIPRDMLSLDIEIRKWISEEIKRGQITLKLTREINEQNIQGFIPTVSYMQSLKDGWVSIAAQLGFKEEDVTLALLLKQLESLPKGSQIEEVEFLPLLKGAFSKALKDLQGMRQREGHILVKQIEDRITFIEELLGSIKDKVEHVSLEYRKKIEDKLKEFAIESAELKERIAREIVLYTDRVDITEEIERLEAHLKSYKEAIGKKETSGKSLEFILMEMNRESNTISSKSQLLDVIKAALAIKSEIEKIREQIQNIE